jgi:replicative DNA helicase
VAIKYANGVVKSYKDKKGKVGRKVQLKLDSNILRMLCMYSFTFNGLITRQTLSNLQKLVEITDDEVYRSDFESYEMFQFIKAALEARLFNNLNRAELVRGYCTDKANVEEIDKIFFHIDNDKELEDAEIKWLNQLIHDRAQYGFIMFYKDRIKEKYDSIQDRNENGYREASVGIMEDISVLQSQIRSVQNVIDGDIRNFSLEEDVFDDTISNIVDKLKDESRKLVTGIRALNKILAPGFLSGRLYTFLARTGNFKSGMLLSIARWIKKYNPNIQAKRHPDAKPAVLLITTENSITETVERLFQMALPGEKIQGLSAKEVIRKLRTAGELSIDENNNIDIRIIYKNDREINTNDIYGIIEDIENEGRCEIVALIVDYIKRIRATESSHGDERVELKNASSELKNLAQNLDIPVITAMQINRSGNASAEMAINQSKEDIGRYLGATNIANCWDIVENSDWVCILNIEQQKKTQDYFLTFKLVKMRYADMSKVVTYFNQPFMNKTSIALVEDFALPRSVALLTLTSDLDDQEIRTRPGEVLKVPSLKQRKEAEKKPETDFNSFCSGF